MDVKQVNTVSFDVVALVPGKYIGCASCAYLYYTPEFKYWSEGMAVNVKKTISKQPNNNLTTTSATTSATTSTTTTTSATQNDFGIFYGSFDPYCDSTLDLGAFGGPTKISAAFVGFE